MPMYLIVPMEDPASRSSLNISSDRNLSADTLEDVFSENVMLVKFENGKFFEAVVEEEVKEDDEEENEGTTYYVKAWNEIK